MWRVFSAGLITTSGRASSAVFAPRDIVDDTGLIVYVIIQRLICEKPSQRPGGAGIPAR